ncbi:MAG: sulfite exporter TauE/SafE family protein [Chlamydiales bacterium]|nr:sulfite exporter TauE/SafE family protein [Chlamydiales bacterium]
MDIFLVFLTFIVTLLAGILSGLSGGGGGFITMPYYIFIGLLPAEALATNKLSGVGNSFGALSAFKGKGFINKKLAIPFMSITLICALASAWLIPQIDASFFQKIIGIILILLIPSLFISKASFQPGERSRLWFITGFIAYTFFTFMQTLFGTGLGIILVIILMLLFGLSTLEANATKRIAQSVQSVILFVLLSLQGLVVWSHGISGLIGASIGTHIGSHIAIKKGDQFAKIMLSLFMAISGLVLLLT